jgi:hypothetical protein
MEASTVRFERRQHITGQSYRANLGFPGVDDER